MTTVKLDAKLATNAQQGLEPLVATLYSRPGVRIVGVIELAHVERTQPAPDEDKEASVKLQVKHLEIARDDQEEILREALRALYLHRTATGTVTEDSDVELSERTLNLVEGHLHAAEVARLRVAVLHWAEYAQRLQRIQNASVTELMHELRAIADGLWATVQRDTLSQPEG